MNLPKTYLTEAIDDQSILRILTQNKLKADPKFDYYKKLADWATSNRRQLEIKNVSLNNIKLSDKRLIDENKLNIQYNSLGSLLDTLKNLMDQKGKKDPELSKLIQQTTLEILAGLSGLKDPKKTDPEQEPDPETKPEPKAKSGVGRDWTAYRAQKLANVKPASRALDEFYDEYYSQEYAGVETPEKDTKGIVAKLKSLDKILIPEFNKLGYNPEVNPFASFLKILIKKESDIFDKLTYNTYGAIHNSFIDKKITGNMLGQKFDEKNILFCSDLYNKHGLDIVKYLDLQNQALAAGENLGIENLVAKIFIQQDVSGTTYSEKINNLKNLKEPTLPGAPEAKLKSELEIRELYRHLFGTAAKKTMDTNTINKILEYAVKQDIAQDLLWFILTQTGFTKKYKTTTETAKKVLAKLGSKLNEIDFDKVQQLLDDYDDLTLAVEKKMADSLIAHLTEKAGAKT